MRQKKLALIVGVVLYAFGAGSLVGVLIVDDLLFPRAFVLVGLSLFVGTALIGLSHEGPLL